MKNTNTLNTGTWAEDAYWTLITDNNQFSDTQPDEYHLGTSPKFGTYREMTETYLSSSSSYKGIALVWTLHDVPGKLPSPKSRYTNNIQFGLDQLVIDAGLHRKPIYKIKLDSPIKQSGNERGNYYSDSITQLNIDGHTCLLFEGTPAVAPGSVDKSVIHDKHARLLDKIADATDEYDFKAVFYRGKIKSMGKDCDHNQARWKLLYSICKYVGFDVELITELFQSCALHHPAWATVGKDGMNKTERTIREILSTRPIFHKNEIENYISFTYDLRFNVVTGKPERRSGSRHEALCDYKFNSILRDVINKGGKLHTQYLRQLLTSDFVAQYDPFKMYFTSLPAWDEADGDPIAELTSKVHTSDDDYWSWCFKKWLVAAVATALDEKTANHQVLVLSGAQGKGKSTFLEGLLPTKLDGYMHSGQLDPTSKDSLAHLAECVLINLDELDSLTRKKEAALKELITKTTIKYRRPYGTFNQSYTRRASFTGSVNHESILSDTTGSRRFLVHKVMSIDYNHELDMDLVWAQAYSLYKDGFKFWFDGKDIDRIHKQNDRFADATPEEELLLSAYKKPIDRSKPTCEALTATQILKQLHEGKLPSNSRSAVIKLGQALAKHNFESIKTKGTKKWLVEQARS